MTTPDANGNLHSGNGRFATKPSVEGSTLLRNPDRCGPHDAANRLCRSFPDQLDPEAPHHTRHAVLAEVLAATRHWADTRGLDFETAIEAAADKEPVLPRPRPLNMTGTSKAMPPAPSTSSSAPCLNWPQPLQEPQSSAPRSPHCAAGHTKPAPASTPPLPERQVRNCPAVQVLLAGQRVWRQALQAGQVRRLRLIVQRLHQLQRAELLLCRLQGLHGTVGFCSKCAATLGFAWVTAAAGGPISHTIAGVPIALWTSCS